MNTVLLRLCGLLKFDSDSKNRHFSISVVFIDVAGSKKGYSVLYMLNFCMRTLLSVAAVYCALRVRSTFAIYSPFCCAFSSAHK